jgi:hypothetical protein
VHGEVVGGGAQRVAHHSAVLRGDVFHGQAHVRRQLASATAAERVANGFVEIATRATALFREIGQLLLGQMHWMLFSHNFSR